MANDDKAKSADVFLDTLDAYNYTVDLCRYDPAVVDAISVGEISAIMTTQLGCYDTCIEDLCGEVPVRDVNESYTAFGIRYRGYYDCVAAKTEDCADDCPSEFQEDTGEVRPEMCDPDPRDCMEIQEEIGEGEDPYPEDNYPQNIQVESLLCPEGEDCVNTEVVADLCRDPLLRPTAWSGYYVGYNNAQIANANYVPGSVEDYYARYCYCFYNKADFLYWEWVDGVEGIIIYFKVPDNVCFGTLFLQTETQGVIYIEVIGDPSGTASEAILRPDEETEYNNKCCPECENNAFTIRSVPYRNPVNGEFIRLLMAFESTCYGTYFATKIPGQTTYNTTYYPYYVLSNVHYKSPGLTGGVVEEIEADEETGEDEYVVAYESGNVSCRSVDMTEYGLGKYVSLTKLGCDSKDDAGNWQDFSMRNVCQSETNNFVELRNNLANSCLQSSCFLASTFYDPSQSAWTIARLKQAQRSCFQSVKDSCFSDSINYSAEEVKINMDDLGTDGFTDSMVLIPYLLSGKI